MTLITTIHPWPFHRPGTPCLIFYSLKGTAKLDFVDILNDDHQVSPSFSFSSSSCLKFGLEIKMWHKAQLPCLWRNIIQKTLPHTLTPPHREYLSLSWISATPTNVSLCLTFQHDLSSADLHKHTHTQQHTRMTDIKQQSCFLLILDFLFIGHKRDRIRIQ